LNFCIRLEEKEFFSEETEFINYHESVMAQMISEAADGEETKAQSSGFTDKAKGAVKGVQKAGAKAKGTANAIKSPIKAAGRNLQNFWKELVKKIKELWNRFIVNVQGLVKRDKDWLTKYKSRIMNASLDGFEWEMFPYWTATTARLQTAKIPVFADNNERFMNALENQDKFREEYFKFLKDVGGDKDSFVDNLKDYFRGGPSVTIGGTALKGRVSSMLDYCMKYDSIITIIQRDHNNIEKTANDAVKISMRATIDAPSKPMAESANIIDMDNSGKIEFSLEGLLAYSEAGAQTLSDVHAAQNEKLKNNLDDSAKKAGTATSVANNSTKDDANDNLKKYQLYVSFCQTVLGAKKSIYEERYYEYMRVLRKIAGMSQGGSNTAKQDDADWNESKNKKDETAQQSTKPQSRQERRNNKKKKK
jgi:hypothetical protein